jgi:hypothetical protein
MAPELVTAFSVCSTFLIVEVQESSRPRSWHTKTIALKACQVGDFIAIMIDASHVEVISVEDFMIKRPWSLDRDVRAISIIRQSPWMSHPSYSSANSQS